MPGPITVQCPNCESKLRIKNSNALGKKAPCPKCGESFVLQAPSDADDDFEFSPDEDFEAPEPPSSRTRSAGARQSGRRSGKGKKSKRSSSDGEWKLPVFLGGGVLLVVGIVIGVFQFLKSNGSTDSVADSSSSPPTASTSTPATTPTAPASMTGMMHGGHGAPSPSAPGSDDAPAPVAASPSSGHGAPAASMPPGYPTAAYNPANSGAAAVQMSTPPGSHGGPSGHGGPSSAFASSPGGQHGGPPQLSAPPGGAGGHGGPSGHGGPPASVANSSPPGSSTGHGAPSAISPAGIQGSTPPGQTTSGFVPNQVFTSAPITAPTTANIPGGSGTGQPPSTTAGSLLGGFAPPMATAPGATPPSGASPSSLVGGYTGTASPQFSSQGASPQFGQQAGQAESSEGGKGFWASLLSGGKSSKKGEETASGTQPNGTVTPPTGPQGYDSRQFYGSAPPNATGPNGLISGPGGQPGANPAGTNTERRPLSSAARRRLREGRTTPKSQDSQ